MHFHRHPDELTHNHRFSGQMEHQNERRMLIVVGLTAATMIAEIGGGILTGSMALLADGWHMGSHVTALGLSVFAYAFARRHADNRRYSFGTGKVGPLAGFTSAILLGLVAVGMAYESIDRMINPKAVDYSAAIVVTVLGLAVNLGSALILGGHNHGHHHHGRNADGHQHEHHQDHNLRSAYVHVLADALTSFLAIVALTGGATFGLWWLDPVIGVAGAIVILWWSFGLIGDSSAVLLDTEADAAIAETIRSRIEVDADTKVVDLHLWLVGTGHLALILSVVSHNPKSPEHYKRLLAAIPHLSHVTVEVITCCEPDRLAA